jgi:serine/threonine protein kinase
MARGKPPELAGFDFEKHIGEGGFADVFLYRQHRPSRPVAVKVLVEAAMSESSIALFNAEADVMAQLAGHQSIVPIFAADIAPDGRPYLVMQYCPGPHRAHHYRKSPLSVAEALDMMVKVAGAVESAHRADILHRDIKPPNILTSAQGEPMLTDFGIAGAMGESTTWSGGMSVPWAPPEAFGSRPPADVRSDVFSLAATTYSLLAGRSPFEIPGAANDHAVLMTRIERQAPARLTRPDVSEELNDLLVGALAKRLEDRPPSAIAFADALQTIQERSHTRPTPVDVLDAHPSADVMASADRTRTRIRPVSIIVPEVLAESGTRLKPAIVRPQIDLPQFAPLGGPVAELDPRSANRHSAESVDLDGRPSVMRLDRPKVEPALPSPVSPRRRTATRVGISTLLLVLGVVAGVAFLAPESGRTPDRQASVAPDTGDALDGTADSGVPSLPEDLKGTLNGSTATFDWTEDKPGDTYTWGYFDENNRMGGFEGADVAGPPLTVPAHGTPTCVWLRPVRKGATPDEPASACAK